MNAKKKLWIEQNDSAVVSHMEPFVEVEGKRVRAPVEPKQTNCNQVEIGEDWHDYECKKKKLWIEQNDSAVVSHMEPFVEVEGKRVRAPVKR